MGQNSEKVKNRYIPGIYILLALIILFQITGFLIGQAIQPDVDGWYQNINRSGFTPPDWAFPVAWGTIYVLLAITAWELIRYRYKSYAGVALSLFVIQMALNWAWSFIFFTYHMIFAALVSIIILLILVLILNVLSFRISRLAGFLLVPYVLWLSYATFLTYRIWMLNPAAG